jgi:YjbE family integral membrane protein
LVQEFAPPAGAFFLLERQEQISLESYRTQTGGDPMDGLLEAQFWLALLQIIGVNIVLSGDNAVVIAMAARSLPAHQQGRAIALGSLAAIVLRVILTIFAVELLKLPYLKLIGSALLLWIAVQLLLPDGDGDGGFESKDTLLAAIKTILVADLVMSLDNVIGVAAAAKGDMLLLILGLAISIPLIVFGSSLVLRLMERFPVVITLGGALLGYIAGDMAVHDGAIRAWVEANALWIEQPAGIFAALLVVGAGKWLSRRAQPEERMIV